MGQGGLTLYDTIVWFYTSADSLILEFMVDIRIIIAHQVIFFVALCNWFLPHSG